MKNIFIPILLFLFTITFICCDREKFDSDNSIPEPLMANIETLKEAPYLMGAAINVKNLKEIPQYRDLVLKEMSSITAENAMKMRIISKGRKQYDFDEADYIVDFAQENNLRMHGHTLIWSKQTPDWIANYQGDSEDFKEIMKEYIHDVVGRYKGKVASWDVLNEIVDDDGKKLRDCIWLEKIGPEYVELAFRYAHEADPDAVLFYNDYGHEYSHARRYWISHISDSLARKGVPIHGIGIQMHTNINRSAVDLRYSITSAAMTNLKIHVSELDVAVNIDNRPDAVFTEEMALQQKESFRAVAKAMADIPADQCFGITMWGVRDGSSKIEWPLAFDNNYERKPAYDGLLQGFYKP